MSDTLITIAFWGIIIVGGLLTLYLLYALVLVLFLGGYAGVFNLFRELRVRRRMRLAGRSLPYRHAIERMARSPGTLILESPTIGWAVSRAWWTPDDVLAIAPTAPPDESERDLEKLQRNSFMNWCHAQYTDLDRGRAYLVAAYNGDRYTKRLAARFPEAKRVQLWSGVLGLSRSFLAASRAQQVGGREDS